MRYGADARHHHRPLRRRQPRARRRQRKARRGRHRRGGRGARRAVVRLLAGRKADGNVDMHRALRIGQRRRQSLVHHRADRAFGQPKARLDHGPHQRGVVEHLMGVALRLARIDTARQHHQRNLLLKGVGDGVDGVGQPRPQRRQQHRQTRPRLPRALGHEAACVLVLDQVKRHPRAVERVEHGEHLAAGDAEGVAAACGGQAPGDERDSGGQGARPFEARGAVQRRR